jgi:hypothetical protein
VDYLDPLKRANIAGLYLRPIEETKKLPKKKAFFPSLIRPSATFSQHKLGEGRDEGGRLSKYAFF